MPTFNLGIQEETISGWDDAEDQGPVLCLRRSASKRSQLF
jgi:hypothetical protein